MKALLFYLVGTLAAKDNDPVFRAWEKVAGRDIPSESVDELFLDFKHGVYRHRLITGKMEFSRYAEILSDITGLSLTYSEWLDGWNRIVSDVNKEIVGLSKRLQERGIGIYAFQNVSQVQLNYLRATPAHLKALSHLKHIFGSCEVGYDASSPSAWEGVKVDPRWPKDQTGESLKPKDVTVICRSPDYHSAAISAGLHSVCFSNQEDIKHYLSGLS